MRASKLIQEYGTLATGNIAKMTKPQMADLIGKVTVQGANAHETIGARLILTVALLIAKEALTTNLASTSKG